MGNEVNYNPDILSCLANLSNDEVFTPPELVNRILDMLPSELWSNPDTRVLDPCCKSGVFLREIAKRMLEGEKEAIPDLQQRIDHIFHNQLYGIAITELTSLLSRRSLYCSKFANGQYSVSHFDDTCGNIRYSNPKHSWDKDGSCIFCGASKSEYGRGEEAENYAYEFIHLTPKQIKELSDMHFDLIIGNPPYQLSDGGAQKSASPIYHRFVEMGLTLKPRYLTMIIPARWYTGGKGLDDFREKMLHNGYLAVLHDFPETSDCFPGLNIRGGVCYFLADRRHQGDCRIFNHTGSEISEATRPLFEKGMDVFIRYNKAIPILHKVRSKNEKTFDSLVSSRKPFGLATNFDGYSDCKNASHPVHLYRFGNDGYVSVNQLEKGQDLVGKNKIFIPYASPGQDEYPHLVISKPLVVGPDTACSETYLVVGPFCDEATTINVAKYMRTKFFRFMLLLLKTTQHITQKVYKLVPMQDFSIEWTDEMLYKKYDISEDEIAFINILVKDVSWDITQEA